LPAEQVADKTLVALVLAVVVQVATEHRLEHLAVEHPRNLLLE
jgi:hypothetical protein